MAKALSTDEVEALLKKRLRRFESAQLVWDALAKAGPDGLTKKEIKAQTGLTDGQVNYAFGFIKDVLMEKYAQPLVCKAGTYRHSLPPEWYEVKDYVDFRVLGILTMVRRIEHVTNASGLKWGKTDPIKTAIKHVTRLREDLEELAGVV
jgi:hypothetical protein